MSVSVKSSQSRYIDTIIRPMREEDLSQVQALDAISFTSPWPEQAYRYELVENPNAYCWVTADADERVVALMVMWLVVDEIHIATLAVHPSHRRHGVARQLVSTGLQALIPKGAISATLEVRAGNVAAQNLYRYFGFETVGQRKGYYQDNKEDAILMTVNSLGVEYLDWLDRGARDPWGDQQPSERQVRTS